MGPYAAWLGEHGVLQSADASAGATIASSCRARARRDGRIRNLPSGARELIDAPEFAVLSTANPDGSHHLCVMWVGRDGDDLLMATRKARPQHRNLRAGAAHRCSCTREPGPLRT